MTPEKRVQNAIVKYLESLEKAGLPIWINRRQAGGFSYKKGLPDIWVVFNGLHIEIEVKADDGELRTSQEKWALRLEKLGIPCICARSATEVREWFEKNIFPDS